MKVTEHLHAIRIPFQIPLPDGKRLERFVYSFVVATPQGITLIDSGVDGSQETIFSYVQSIGFDVTDIKTLVLTHSHPDHIGSAKHIVERCSCTVVAHEAERDWVEETVRQNRERPVPSFDLLVAGPVHVDKTVAEGDCVDAVNGLEMFVIHTPGHSRGSISLHIPHDRALVTGDAVPVPLDLPIFDNCGTMRQSAEKLRSIPQVDVLLSSWDEPRRGDDVRMAFQKGIAYLDRIAEVTAQIRWEKPELDPLELTRSVLGELGLPPHLANPLVVRSIVSCK